MSPKNIVVDNQVIPISHPDKILFPEINFTKSDLVDYYFKIADYILPHLKDRPLNLLRAPNGLTGESFYQQDASDYFPDWIKTVTVKKEGGTVHHVLCDDVASLVYLSGQATVTFHRWLSQVDDLHKSNLMIFDFDPPGEDFDAVRMAAKKMKGFLEERGITPFIMTTGSSGVHVVVPLKPESNFDKVREVARNMAEELAKRHPKELTTEPRKTARKGRVFIDYLRNSYGQTAVAPYSVRLRPTAPVATPLDWDELNNPKLNAQTYTLKNIWQRLKDYDDPWKDMQKSAISLSKFSDLQ